MMYWIIHVIALGSVSILAFRYVKGNFSPTLFWIALGLKFIAGLVLGYIFFEYYGDGDSIRFFELAKKGDLSTLKSQPRTLFYVSILRPIVLVSDASYWISSLWLSLIGFFGCWYATVVLSKIYPNIRYVIASSFLLIPSIVFWSSGILKDTISFSALAILVSLTIKAFKTAKSSIPEIAVSLFMVFILFKLKHYLLIIALIFIGILGAFSIINRIKGNLKWPLASSLFIAMVICTQFIHPYLKFNRLAWAIYENNRAINLKKTPNDNLNIIIKDDSWSAILESIPSAIHAGLFRPSILDNTPALGLVHRIENLILSFLLLLSMLLLVKKKSKVEWPIVLASSFCILILATLLPLSTPNFGTLVRYKNAFMPYLFMLSSILPYHYFSSRSVE